MTPVWEAMSSSSKDRKGASVPTLKREKQMIVPLQKEQVERNDERMRASKGASR